MAPKPKTTIEQQWAAEAAAALKAAIAARGVTYAEAAALLARAGLGETESALKNKLSRGSFSAGYLLAALDALGASPAAIGRPAGLRRRRTAGGA